MSTEEEIPIERNLINNNAFERHISKKRKTNIIMCAVAILFIVLFVVFLFIVCYEYWPEDNSTIYITAVYSPEYKYGYCELYDNNTINNSSSISSITIDGKRVKISPALQFDDDGKKTVVIKFKEKVKSMARFFYYIRCLRTVDFSNFDTSEIKDMSEMFRESVSLTSITWGSKFDTRNVETMFSMFQHSGSIETLNLSSFKSSALKNATNMFSNCYKIKKIDLRNFGEKLNSTSGLFNGLGGSGTLMYNSSIMKSEVLESLPSTWNKTDVNV